MTVKYHQDHDYALFIQKNLIKYKVLFVLYLSVVHHILFSTDTICRMFCSLYFVVVIVYHVYVTGNMVNTPISVFTRTFFN